ncbi:4Fe-4S binding protein [bacterium]|nr:4Fe-4S binding protein [bacterium]
MCCHCGGCVSVCKANALVLTATKLEINPSRCNLCKICLIVCPYHALGVSYG